MIIHTFPPQKKLHLVIHGRVQGVFFRNSMRLEAQKLEVSGWVRNRSDGSVEAAVHGDSAAVDALVRWAQHGPEFAHVDRVEIELDGGSYNSFEVIG
jgi:acylphosphatase